MPQIGIIVIAMMASIASPTIQTIDLGQNVYQAEKDLFFSAYDPQLWDEMNCFGDCRYTGFGYTVDEWYYRGAACPQGWAGRIIQIPGDHTFKCIDRGGMVIEDDNMIVVDLLIPHSEIEDFPYSYGAIVPKEDWVYSD